MHESSALESQQGVRGSKCYSMKKVVCTYRPEKSWNVAAAARVAGFRFLSWASLHLVGLLGLRSNGSVAHDAPL